ncbi:MAG: hypothetical protein K2O00_06840 [Muribaculaceae bacterium]|nr:hypothetical protein [Muribaculaceae bacterium]
MLKFGKPYIESSQDYAILKNEVEIDGLKQTLWFKVDKKYEQFLCYERGDAYLIASLNYAMINHHDIEIDVPVTSQLLFNIQNYLIPALIENNPQFHAPKIKAPIDASTLPNFGAVGTGISCGVDSLHVLATKTNTIFKDLNVTHLTFNNVGSHGEGQHARELFKKRSVRPAKFAEEYNYEFVHSDSNLMDVLKQNHFKTHTYSSMFPIFCLQKLYSVFFYASSGYKFSEFQLIDAPVRSCGAYDLLSLDVFSTSSLRIYSEGMGKSRLAKLREVVKYSPSYKYLNVCLSDGDNCGVCEKCVRTLLGLDALGVVEKYSEVFDVDYFKKHKKWYLQQMLYRMADGKHDYFEMYPYFKKEITFDMRVKKVGYICTNKIANVLRKYPRFFSAVKKLVKAH